MRPVIAIGLLVTLGACASTVPPYIGRGGNQLFLAWGSPERTVRMPDGGNAVTFLRPGCETTFVMDYAGVVRSGSQRGDGCPQPRQ